MTSGGRLNITEATTLNSLSGQITLNSNDSTVISNSVINSSTGIQINSNTTGNIDIQGSNLTHKQRKGSTFRVNGAAASLIMSRTPIIADSLQIAIGNFVSIEYCNITTYFDAVNGGAQPDFSIKSANKFISINRCNILSEGVKLEALNQQFFRDGEVSLGMNNFTVISSTQLPTF